MHDDPLDRLAALNRPGSADANKPCLTIGSDIEIALRLRADLERRFGETVHVEGKVWRYEQTQWSPVPEHELRLAAHSYDGATFGSGRGEPSLVKLSKQRLDSILHELAVLLTVPEFFSVAPTGINCASGFIRFSAAGAPSIEPHHRDHRCRHTLAGRWTTDAASSPEKGSLLTKLLSGVFADDQDAADKVNLLAEIAGSAALGYATKLRQARAVILKGETAQNGKSQVLDLFRAVLPASATASVTAGCMGDERHIVGLAGKLLNASDELSSSSAIASDTFKAIVTGEPVQGRDVYKSRIEFRPLAQHVFATNTLPMFKGGMDRGVQRRLLVITFNRVIPEEERVEAIGQRIGREEPNLLLAWAVAGAARLIAQRGFTLPASSNAALNDWLYGADPVLAWLNRHVSAAPVIDHCPRLRTADAYRDFRDWALSEGFAERTLPTITSFVPRITANTRGIQYRRLSHGAYFYGLVLHRACRPTHLDNEDEMRRG